MESLITRTKWIIPQAWVDYSEEKIGTPISTNQEHRLSWNVKQDWAEQTGSPSLRYLPRRAAEQTNRCALPHLALE